MIKFEWRRRPLFYAALAASGVIFFWDAFHLPVYVPKNDISHELSGKTAAVFLGGQVDSEVETREGRFGGKTSSFILKTERLWEGLDHTGRNIQGRVRVSWNRAPEELRYGQTLVLEGQLAEFRGVRNPGGFDAKAYWERQNIRGAFYARTKSRFKFLSHQGGNPLKAAAIRVKQTLSRRLAADFKPQEAAFLQALFLGEKKELDQDFKDLFLKTGTLHILAVSGFNIGFLTAIVWLFLKPFPLNRRVKTMIALVFVWGYCLLVGWQAPVMRASVMATLLLAGSLTGRKADGLNSLGLAALVIFAVAPKQLFDVGFQLSFMAVFALIVFSPAFIRRPELLPHEKWTLREKAVFYVEELFWVSFICVMATLTITVQNFFIVTPYALLANLIVVPASFLLFLAGAVYFAVYAWLPGPMHLLMLVMTRCLFFMENLPGSAFIVGKLPILLGAALFKGILYFLWDKRIVSRRVRAAVLILFCASVFMAGELWRGLTRRFEMTMLDVGQGDAAYFQFPEGGNLLVDAGGARFSDKGRWVVSPFLKSKGVRSLDAVALSHPQEDHVGGLFTVLEDFQVKNVFDSGRPYDSRLWKDLQRKIAEEKCAVWEVARGDVLAGYPGVRIDILHPEKDAPPAKNINNDCVVLKVRYGRTSFLMTGDIEGPAMRSLLDTSLDLRADVLKVPHHGGKLAEEGPSFIEEVGPRLSLISVGERNPFGHPAPWTLEVLNGIPGNRVLRTDQEGAISLVSDGRGIALDGNL